MIPTDKLKEWAGQQGILLDAQMLARFEEYAPFICAYNEQVILTAITEPVEIAAKHFLDSLLLLAALPVPKGARMADVGSGAGFPGVPLKIARPDLSLTLIDSLKKRILFLQQLSGRLEMPFEALHLRAEEAGRQKGLRGQFDIAAARAVASLPVLCEYCLPLLKIGGVFAALKSRGVEEELRAAERALSLLGGEMLPLRRFPCPAARSAPLCSLKKYRKRRRNIPAPRRKWQKARCECGLFAGRRRLLRPVYLEIAGK